MSALFDRIEPPACLSGRRISLAALDELDPDERAIVDAHLATCGRCPERIAREREAIAAAANEPLPDFAAARQAEVIPLRPLAKSRRRTWATAAGVVAMAALLFLVVRPTGPDPRDPFNGARTRAKGAPKVEIAIQRDGALVGEAVGIALAPALRPGDELRLRVGRSAGIYITVEGFDEGGWVELYRGVIPDDGWLPMGAVVTPGESRVRLVICPSEHMAVGAAECSQLEHTFVVGDPQ